VGGGGQGPKGVEEIGGEGNKKGKVKRGKEEQN